MNKNITEATEDAPILCQSIPQVFFHPDEPTFSPSILTDRAGWTNLLAIAGAAHAVHALTDTTASNTTTPVAIGSGKINPNHTRPMEGPAATPILPTNPDGDVMSAASSGDSGSKSEYVESPQNFLTSSSNITELACHIR